MRPTASIAREAYSILPTENKVRLRLGNGLRLKSDSPEVKEKTVRIMPLPDLWGKLPDSD
jgi:hypothetical protein